MNKQNTSTINMEYRALGDLEVSALGLGGLHFGNLCDQVLTNRIIHQALDAGVNFIDTGPLYGDSCSEAFIGNAIRGRRYDVIIATKVGLESRKAEDGTFGVAVIPLNERNIRSGLEKSLKALGTDYVDLYQVHAFDHETPIEETMAILDSLVNEGKVRFIGCSNYLQGELRTASEAARKNRGTDFVSFQAHYNLIERRAEQEVLQDCRNLGVGVVCNRPLSRGILTGKYKIGRNLPESSRAVFSYRIRRWLLEPTLNLVAAFEEFARHRGHTVVELAIAWLLAQPGISSVLAGARNIQQLEANIKAIEMKLSEDDLMEIDKIIEGMDLMSQVKSMPECLFET
jgi:aryl-alcohol dehydrogenase-like predicted oxidoreductase